jgi:competence protein ComEC
MPRAGWVAAGAVGAALASEVGRGFGSERPLAATLILGSAGVLLIAWATRARARRPVALAGGVLVLGCRLVVAEPTPATPISLPTGSGPWLASVAALAAPRNGTQPATLMIELEGSSTVSVAAMLPRYPQIRPELEIRVAGRIEPPPDDDYGRYLEQAGVAGTMRATDVTIVGESSRPADAIEALRRWADEGLARSLPEPEAGLASGILIGLRDRVDRDLAAAFTTAGVSHVVAISGWNIAIVGATIGALVRRWPRRRRALLVLGAICLYTILTGASSSVLRAAVMAAVVLLARETGRAGTAATALGWAVVLLLTIDPGYVADPGFALSAAATGGLIAWATPLTAGISHLGRGRLPGWLAESLGVSIAAEIATLPIALAEFGRFAVLAPLVNLFVVPLVAPAMAAGAIGLVGGSATLLGLPSAIATIAGLPGWAALTTIVLIVRVAAAIPIASVILVPPFNLLAAAAAGVLILFIANRRRFRTVVDHRGPAMTSLAEVHAARPTSTPRRMGRAERAAIVVAFAVLGATTIVAVNRPDGVVHVHVLDVGQGDAILVDADRGARMLVDGGPDPDRLLVALDSRIAPWDRRIDLVVLTHPHEDHVAGLAVLLARYRIGRVVEPGMLGPGPGYRAWQAELGRRGVATGRLSTGDRFALDDVPFRVLWPDPGRVPKTPPDTGTGINNVSIVLLGSFGAERFLLAGDIEEEIDPILIGRGLPNVELLKVAHHGSRTSSTDAFLGAVRPRIGVVSVGAKNPYGHPAPATIDRLLRHGIAVYRTDQNGTVDINLDGRIAVASADRPLAGSDGQPAVAASTVRAPAGAASRPRRGLTADASALFSCGVASRVGLGLVFARGRTAPTGRAVSPAASEPSGSRRRDLRTITAAAAPARPTIGRIDDQPWTRLASLYDRPHDGSGQGRGLPAAPVPRSAFLGAAARTGRGRGRCLARRADRRSGNARRPTGRRGRRAAPRRRQGPAGLGAGARPPPR